jgi:sugar lactone lactonase YvrE
MDDAEVSATGSLYCVDVRGKAVIKDSGYVITNGPCVSPDGRIFYHTDTLAKTVYAFDVSTNQTLSNKQALIHIKNGYPDGTVVDAEGCLWVSLFAGGRIERYSPSGELLQSVKFPCPNVTKMAFGGADLRTAYVTTAWKGMSARQREESPLAGGLFSFEVDTPGLPQGLISKGLY